MSQYKPIGLYRLEESDQGSLRVWEGPKTRVQVGDRERISNYVIGADVAEGLPHGDYSSAHVINHATGLVVAHWHGKCEADYFGELLYELAWWYNCALLGVEANYHGISTLHQLRRDGYPRLYMRRSVGKDFNKTLHQLGWYTSKTTKPLMLDELARSIRHGELEIHCPDTIQELMTFVRDTDDGSLHGSPHDDRVMSLAIANQMRAFATAPEYQPDLKAPEYSVSWWADLLDDVPEKERNSWTIGRNNSRSRERL